MRLSAKSSRDGAMALHARARRPRCPLRALKALQSRGIEYAWHKVLRRSLSRRPSWKRRLLYARSPASIGHCAAAMIIFANRKARKPARYGRHGSPQRLASISPNRSWKSAAVTAGCSASLSRTARRSADRHRFQSDSASKQRVGFCRRNPESRSILGRGERLPFPDRSFDMVVTSAVILHNPPAGGRGDPPGGAASGTSIRGSQRRNRRQLQPLRLRYRRLVSRPRHRARPSRGRFPMDPDQGASQFCVAVLATGICDRAALSRFLSTRRRTP